MTIRVGILGTSWWTDSMYLPALADHPDAEVVGLCGRRRGRAEELARSSNVPWASDDAETFLDPDRLDAAIVATTNDTHEQLTTTALDRGIHVMCEKPIATTVDAANRMATHAADVGAITMVPFTYRYMPTNRFVKRLIDDGYVGEPHHLDLRYFTGFAREPGYNWRFDDEIAGSGVLGDLGTHWLDLARWFLGEIDEIGCVSARHYERPPRPDGSEYSRGEDSAIMTARFANGAIGMLHVSAACSEGTEFNQTHHLDLHGTDGTIYSIIDWEETQIVRGVRSGERGPAAVLPVPDDIWGEARRDRVHDTYRDVFRVDRAMTGDWIDAIVRGGPITPDLARRSAALDGRLLDARPRT